MAFAEAPELAGTAPLAWAEANLRHLHAELARLDIAIRRRARAAAGAADARTVDDDRSPEETALTAARRLAGQHRAGLMAAGHPPALETLASTLALSRFETDVVLWALAPELGVAIAATPEALASAPHGLEPSPSRCLEEEAAVGEPGWLEARAAFLPDGPLRRFRIIVDEPGPEPPERRPFRLDPRIVCYLLGRDTSTSALRPSCAGLPRPSTRAQLPFRRCCGGGVPSPPIAVQPIGPSSTSAAARATGARRSSARSHTRPDSRS